MRDKVLCMIVGIGYLINTANEVRLAKKILRKNKKERSQQ